MSLSKDIEFAYQVLRIRNEMISDEICNKLPVGWTFGANFQIKSYFYRFKNYRGHRLFGDVNSLHYNIDSQTSFISNMSFLYIADSNVVSFAYKEKDIPIVEFTEELYFQYSLLYSDKELRWLVVASILYNNPIKNCKRFKIRLDYIQILTKLLRYSDYGII
ncbi:hypothetical protein SEPL_368 [Salmonella phage SE_PL]|nr:hypothetical protein CPT_Munch_054 [Salmonella phage Munch]QCW18728.1 hypothetical protein 7t3_0207 [Salmonella phage 7t3]QIG62981.1 hypothetical protein SEPL_368 [Salmonella phage SE_PL]WNV47160.1 hypothetical protein [Klebsiella phage fENko-Kae01]